MKPDLALCIAHVWQFIWKKVNLSMQKKAKAIDDKIKQGNWKSRWWNGKYEASKQWGGHAYLY
jgi:hypothetical protein